MTDELYLVPSDKKRRLTARLRLLHDLDNGYPLSGKQFVLIEEMERSGLIADDQGKLYITNSGRRFIKRHAAMYDAIERYPLSPAHQAARIAGWCAIIRTINEGKTPSHLQARSVVMMIEDGLISEPYPQYYEITPRGYEFLATHQPEQSEIEKLKARHKEELIALRETILNALLRINTAIDAE